MHLSDCGENAWIERLGRLLGVGPDRLGDDAAVIPMGEYELVMTSDAVIEGRHFVSGENPDRVGRKAAGRALSDLAAMGANPHSALVNLAVPAETEIEWMERVMIALSSVAREHGMIIRGGDTSAASEKHLHIFAVGTVPLGSALFRSSARIGHAIFVTGTLGGSLDGHHLDFTPRLSEGQWLRKFPAIGALMDITDGLAMDLPRLCRASGVGARIDTRRLPISQAAHRRFAAGVGSEPVSAALGDGEDYELLFTCEDTSSRALENEWGKAFPHTLLTRIGTCTQGQAVEVISPQGTLTALGNFGGYEHFRTPATGEQR